MSVVRYSMKSVAVFQLATCSCVVTVGLRKQITFVPKHKTLANSVIIILLNDDTNGKCNKALSQKNVYNRAKPQQREACMLL